MCVDVHVESSKYVQPRAIVYQEGWTPIFVIMIPSKILNQDIPPVLDAYLLIWTYLWGKVPSYLGILLKPKPVKFWMIGSIYMAIVDYWWLFTNIAIINHSILS